MRIGSGPSIQASLPAAPAGPQRWSTSDRAAVYQQVVRGAADGATTADVQANRALTDLWLRFVASTAHASRQAPDSTQPPAASADLAALARRDFAAAALPRVDAAWSHRDQWSVVDQVGTLALGGASNTARHRSLAEAGGAVLEWLSAHRDGVDDRDPDDRSLADSVERWLAVTVTADGDVEVMSSPQAARARATEWSNALFSALGYPQGTTDARAEGPRRLVALFEGEAGTGKTFAAHWLATSLGSTVYRVDLSQLVSKYIGETEKNLERLFGSARASDAVLLFDEADALFGQRTDVRDSHDRYANVEVNSLLQRIERFNGVMILTSNAAAAIAPTLRQRANAVVVAFPLPPR